MRNNIFSALTVLLALVPALASADGGCRQFVGVGTTQATGPESFAGTATSKSPASSPSRTARCSRRRVTPSRRDRW